MNKTITFLRAAEEELETILKDAGIYDKVKALEAIIAAYRETANRSIIPVSDSPVQPRANSSTFKGGIVDYIKERGEVIRLSEYENHLKSQGHNPKSLTSAFQDIKTDGLICIHKINDSNKKGYYGLPEWFENGEPKIEYWSKSYREDKS